MNTIESSIIIPVYNKWELTRNCLKSLASTLDKEKVEVIVVDNASGDVTPKAAAFLGRQLFGDNFRLVRNEINRNFAGACNQGADQARGHFLIFLNNDTVAEPDWYEPLIGDFERFPDIAGTGPLLVYPERGPWGRPVQHLGVFVSPFLKFGHLYNGIPESSPLAKKRRFFQAITGACLVMPKSIFMDIGKFDEGYINGFEDVDLCARLVGKGFRFTVNPESVLVHLEGQTPGRKTNDTDNYSLLRRNSIRFCRPDWAGYLEKDGFGLAVNDWVHLQPGLNRERSEKLERKLPFLTQSELKSLLRDNIYWQAGWEKFLAGEKGSHDYMRYIELYFNFFRTVPNAAMAVRLGEELGVASLIKSGASFLRGCQKSSEELLEDARAAREWCKRLGLANLEGKYTAWIQNYGYFRDDIYPIYIDKYFSVLNN